MITEVDTELEIMEYPEGSPAEDDADGGDSSANDPPEESELNGLESKQIPDLNGRDTEFNL